MYNVHSRSHYLYLFGYERILNKRYATTTFKRKKYTSHRTITQRVNIIRGKYKLYI